MTNTLKLSVSKCKTFLDCRSKYKYCYIDKLPKKTWDFHTLGKFVHKVLEDFHQEYLNGSTEEFNIVIAKVYKSALIEYAKDMTPEIKKDTYAMINAYLKIMYDLKAKNNLPNVLSCEQNFKLSMVDEDKSIEVVLNGQIDRVQIDPDGIVHVCDYKTVKNKNYLKKDFFQLLTYAYVLLHEDPSLEKIRGSYILLRHNFEYITTEFTRDEILSVKDKFLTYGLDIINEKLYRPNPSPLCGYCDFLENCESGKRFTMKDSFFGKTDW